MVSAVVVPAEAPSQDGLQQVAPPVQMEEVTPVSTCT